MELDPAYLLHRLEELDPSSRESISFLKSIVSESVYANLLTKFKDSEVRAFIDILDRAIGSIHADDELQVNGLQILRKLCGQNRILPSSHMLTKELTKLGDVPVARGGFSDVWKGVYCGHYVAIKYLRVYSFMRKEMEKINKEFCKEVVIWKKLSHPNVVPFLGVPNTTNPAFALISKWIPGGTIRTHISNHPTANRLQLLLDITDGLKYLHSLHVVHGDLKGDNILIDENYRALLFDFGLSSFGPESQIESSAERNRGTARWMAPELYDMGDADHEYRGPSNKTDIYAWSMVAIEVFTGKVPYYGLRDITVMMKSASGCRPNRPEARTLGLSDDVWEMVQKCWATEPAERPKTSSIKECLEAAYGKISLQHLMRFDPTSSEFIQDLEYIIDFKHNALFKLYGDDAQIVVNTLDQAMNSRHASDELRNTGLLTLKELCDRNGMFPFSHVLNEGLTKLGDRPFASGGIGDVWKGTYSDRHVAIKILRVDSYKFEETRKLLCKDVITWKRLSHPNVVQFFGISTAPSQLCMVSEWMTQGNVREYLLSNSDADRLELMVDVSEGLKYLHSLDIVHGNLKGHNILINEAGRACLSDFGTVLFEFDPTPLSTLRDPRESVRWMAPELLELDGRNITRPTEASDIYALAMVTIEVFTGRVPLPTLPNASVIFQILNGKRPSRPNETRELGLYDNVWELIQTCWQQEPGPRPKISVVLVCFCEAAAARCILPEVSTANSLSFVPPPIEHDSNSSLALPKTDLSYDLIIPYEPERDANRHTESLAIVFPHLRKLDPKSEAFSAMLRDMLHSQGYPNFIVSLQDDEIHELIDLFDKALDNVPTSTELFNKCLHALGNLCRRAARLPSSCAISEGQAIRNGNHPASFGGFADVWTGTFKQQKVALKFMKCSNERFSRTWKALCKEVVVWKRLSHPNILPLFGVSTINSRPCFISEWMENGTIIEYLKARPEENRLAMLSDVANGCEYLHSSGVVHGDLKGSNILVDHDRHALLADFGLAFFTTEEPSLNAWSGINMPGTVRWMAPELLNAPGPNIRPSPETDIYSFAMIVVEVFTTKVPFSNMNDSAVLFQVVKGLRPVGPEEARKLGLSEMVWNMVNACWQEEPELRPKISDVTTCFSEAAAVHSLLLASEVSATSGIWPVAASQDTTPYFIASSPDKSVSLDIELPFSENPSQDSIVPYTVPHTTTVNTDHDTFTNIDGKIPHNMVPLPENITFKFIRVKLQPAIRDSVPGCMPGTRTRIFNEIDRWLDDFNEPNILWLSGSPGAGKSAIASTMVSTLTKRGHLGSYFFFRRGHIILSDPTALWRTVACDLAERNSDFAAVIATVLKEKEADFKRSNVGLYFKHLIQGPLTVVDYPIPSVVVIDALDECGSEDSKSQVAQKKALFDTLIQWSYLSKKFKLIVTGRNDRIETSFYDRCTQIVLSTGSDLSTEANEDIRRFVEQSSVGLKLLPKKRRQKLIDKLTTDELFDLVLDGDLGDKDKLTNMYRQLLHSSFPGIAGHTLEAYKVVVSAVVLTKVHLCREDLCLLLSKTPDMVQLILDKLSPVISVGVKDKCLRIAHPSFSEFLCDPKRCPEVFFIDREKDSRMIAMACLEHMKDRLKFNICDLETSFFRNDQVNDLSERIRTKVPRSLLYSCRYWAAHLQDTVNTPGDYGTLLARVKEFFLHHLLFWLEVMSLTNDVSAANISLLSAVPWLEEHDAQLSAFARDASRFIVNFDIPITASVPHIYLSALPFSPSESLVAQQYQSLFSNTLSVVSGRDKKWPEIVNLFRGHTGAVRCVSFSRDGSRIVSGSDDKTIQIWDAETSQITAGLFQDHGSSVRSVTFLPDGKAVISGSDDRTIRIWNIDSDLDNRCFPEGHSGVVTSLAFSRDGKKIVSGSEDKRIRIWNKETGQVITFEGTGPVISVAFSPDDKKVFSATSDWPIQILDVDTGRITLGPFGGYTKALVSIALSDDGAHIVSGSFDGTVRIWDVKTGQVIAGPFEGHEEAVRAVAFSPDGRRVVSGSDDKTIRIWDVRMHQTGKTVASSAGRTVPVWDVESPINPSPQMERHMSKMTSISGGQTLNCFRGNIVDGWLLKPDLDSAKLDGQNQLLFYVPRHCRNGLCGIETKVVFGAHPTRVDLSRFKYGESWMKCYLPPKIPLSTTSFASVTNTPTPEPPSPVEDLRSCPSSVSGLSDVDSASRPAIHHYCALDEPLQDHLVPESDRTPSWYVHHSQTIAIILLSMIVGHYLFIIHNSAAWLKLLSFLVWLTKHEPL